MANNEREASLGNWVLAIILLLSLLQHRNVESEDFISLIG